MKVATLTRVLQLLTQFHPDAEIVIWDDEKEIYVPAKFSPFVRHAIKDPSNKGFILAKDGEKKVIDVMSCVD